MVVDEVPGVILVVESSGKCQISPSQARKIMRMLVLDKLLYFEPRVNDMDAFKADLRCGRFFLPFAELEFWENYSQRVVLAFVGGTDAGEVNFEKSSI